MRSIKVKRWITPVTCFVLFVFSFQPVRAQTFAEWWNQKNTQKKYLLQQIAALQVYIGYAKKGYEIAGNGLSTIRDITNGEFKLHDLFITGLEKVSPAIRNDARVAGIILLQIEILKAFSGLAGDNMFSGDRLDYLLTVKAAVTEDCLKDMEELLLVIASGKAEMTDDERIVRLNGIYGRMRDKAAFTQDFSTKALLLLNQLNREQNTVNELRRYYEKD